MAGKSKQKASDRPHTENVFNLRSYGSISEREDETIKWWKANKTFEKSIEIRPDDRQYSFLDGPPFVTGTPHYGSLLPRMAKDVIPRYKTMKGYQVRRVWGWDCHGLPIEEKVERKLGIKNRREIEKYGIPEFIEACRTYVEETSSDWEWYVDKIGEWIDFKGAYYTMSTDYMESVIWVFKSLYDKGLLYEGGKTLLFCTRCGTPVSKFEIAMDDSYRDMEDPAITVEFPIKTAGDFKDMRILAWTTTPWTIPSNRGLVLAGEENYVAVKPKDSDKTLILARQRLPFFFKNEDEYEVVKEFKGKELVGLEYEPPFDFIPGNGKDFHVYDFPGMATMEEGTGIVHSAPGFGEIDTQMGEATGLTLMLTIDDEGKFTDKIPDYKGIFYKEADPKITAELNKRGKLFKEEKITHRFPFCYRCGTPLIQKYEKGWFIDVKSLKSKLLETSNSINFVPSKIFKRFYNNIETAPDWNISRSRFWATIMPIWECDKCEHRDVFGSIKEIEEKSGQKVTGLHRNDVDHITYKCEKCDGTMKRIPDVLDVWMDSGSMPYGQVHYPFENEELFKQTFPGDYIIEYVGQIRAWFYVMHVISNALMGEVSYKNVVVTGTMSGTDGRKMSKSYGNYPDPKDTLIKFGGDALRLYFMGSPIMVGEDANFSEADLKAQVTRVIFPLWNSVSYFATYANLHNWKPKSSTGLPEKLSNPLDKWMIARLKAFKFNVEQKLDEYYMPDAVRHIAPFIDDLSTWYIRRSRQRFVDGDKDALQTLYTVLVETAKIVAPIAPFISEEMYQRLVKDLFSEELDSVHLQLYPEYPKLSQEEENLIATMSNVRDVVSLGQAVRVESHMKVRQPLAEAQIKGAKFDDEMTAIIKDELNVEKVSFVDEVEKSWPTQEMKDIAVALDTNLTEELRKEGLYKELARQLQNARKNAGLKMGEVVELVYHSTDEDIDELLSEYAERLGKDVSLRAVSKSETEPEKAELIKVDDNEAWVAFKK